MYLFKTYFQMLREEVINSKLMSKFYTWSDRHWSGFMVSIMSRLEPRKFLKGEIIFKDMEEVDDIIFVLHGEVSFYLLI